MNISIVRQPKSKVSLTISIEPKEMAAYFERASGQLAREVSVPGFRHGKAPRSVLASRVGPEYLTRQALEIAVTDSYYEAVKKHHLKPIARPQTDIPTEPAHLERDGLTFTATVDVMPEVELGEYRSVKIKPIASVYTDKLLNETLAQLRKSRSTFNDVDRAAQAGDRVEIDFVGTLKGKEVTGAKSENHPTVIGEDNFIPGFSDQLKKMRAGQIKKFKLKFPKDYREDSLAGQKVEFTVTMRKIQEVALPELDDAFAKGFGATSLKDLKQRLEENLRREKESEARRETEMAVVEKVMDQSSVEIPEAIVEEELSKMMGEFRQNVDQQSLPYDDYLKHLGKTEADIRSESRPEAERRAKMSLVINAIQRKENIVPDQKAVQAEIDQQLALAQDDQTKERIKTDEFKQYATHVLGNRLTVAKLVEWAS